MSATATDTLTVSALTREDAKDKARWQWEAFGFRVLNFIGTPEPVTPASSWQEPFTVTPATYQWRVTAEVEVRR